jgi:hypothetical protein
MYWELTRNVPSTVRLEEHANTDIIHIANKLLIGTCSCHILPLVWTLRRYASYRRDVVMLDVGKELVEVAKVEVRSSKFSSFRVPHAVPIFFRFFILFPIRWGLGFWAVPGSSHSLRFEL